VRPVPHDDPASDRPAEEAQGRRVSSASASGSGTRPRSPRSSRRWATRWPTAWRRTPCQTGVRAGRGEDGQELDDGRRAGRHPDRVHRQRRGESGVIGHPSEMDKPLAEVVAGKYDIAKAKADLARQQVEQKRFQAAVPELKKSPRWPRRATPRRRWRPPPGCSKGRARTPRRGSTSSPGRSSRSPARSRTRN